MTEEELQKLDQMAERQAVMFRAAFERFKEEHPQPTIEEAFTFGWSAACILLPELRK